MTAIEFINHLNKEFGLNNWPSSYHVDSETYANCCQMIFDHTKPNIYRDDYLKIELYVGLIYKGLMFKNIELVLRDKDYVIPTNLNDKE